MQRLIALLSMMVTIGAVHAAEPTANISQGTLVGKVYRDFAADLRRHLRGEPTGVSCVPGLAETVRGLVFIEAVLHSDQKDGAWVDIG